MSNDGAWIHDVATGPAAKVVEKHREPQELIFYSGWFCPYVQRTWIALEEKGIPYQYKEVNPYKKEKHFLEINPKGLVPAIEYKGKALYESLILCEFLEDAYPSYGPNLLTTDPYAKAYIRIWLDFISKTIVPTNLRLTMAQDPAKQKEYLQEYNEALRTLMGKAKGPYFLGEEFSLVDVAIAPWILRDYVLSENRGYSREGVSPEWKAYCELLEKRPSVANTFSEKKYLQPIYNRYLSDTAQSAGAQALRAGKAIP
ncbi:hypothetical protein NM688_g3193 [Phlebia brevispora]|uniref:Uncharacterized protein n=1 Tax=Phlebia brevispora TaxID=194682 RepID=A0ACC1T6L7_9APHY|nr:hypothetical protein NM688_g3193 [Phlebia brevispora]